jgi:hypothetical protein
VIAAAPATGPGGALRRLVPAAAVVVATMIAATPAVAGCGGADLGGGEVAGAIDARTLRLADGREVRLAGLAPLAVDGAALARFAGRRVTLRGSDMPDRYGRQTLIVVAEGEVASIQAALIGEGAALRSGLVTEPGCAAELAAAEAVARKAGTGVWSDPAFIKSAERPQDILAKLGQFAIVEGVVRSVRAAGATVYVDFGRRWSRDFAVTIPRRLVAGFEAAGRAPASLTGRRVRVRGIIGRRGGPRVAVMHPGQIELVDASQQDGSGQRERP